MGNKGTNTFTRFSPAYKYQPTSLVRSRPRRPQGPRLSTSRRRPYFGQVRVDADRLLLQLRLEQLPRLARAKATKRFSNRFLAAEAITPGRGR